MTRRMTAEETTVLLRGTPWGILATAGADGPYAVPVAFAWHAGAVYVATGPGRKLTHLRENPAVCLTLAEVSSAERWRSAVVRGAAEELHGLGRVRGLAALARQWLRGGGRAPDRRRLAGAVVFRVRPVEVTGRAMP